MVQVGIHVNGREYKVTCDDGQEDRLRRLAGFFDRHVTELTSELGQIGDARLMLLAALTICDELFEARLRVEDLETAARKLEPDTEGAASRAIEAATARVNEIADRLAPAP
jgi:cell division protein ZapA